MNGILRLPLLATRNVSFRRPLNCRIAEQRHSRRKLSIWSTKLGLCIEYREQTKFNFRDQRNFIQRQLQSRVAVALHVNHSIHSIYPVLFARSYSTRSNCKRHYPRIERKHVVHSQCWSSHLVKFVSCRVRCNPYGALLSGSQVVSESCLLRRDRANRTAAGAKLPYQSHCNDAYHPFFRFHVPIAIFAKYEIEKISL